jgi:hypothetical protein
VSGGDLGSLLRDVARHGPEPLARWMVRTDPSTRRASDDVVAALARAALAAVLVCGADEVSVASQQQGFDWREI